MTALPPELGQLQNLTHLDLMDNRLTAMPPELGQLQNLTHLNLMDNRLTALPPELGQLQNLTHLELRENRLTALPPELGQLQSLKYLDLHVNPLTGCLPAAWRDQGPRIASSCRNHFPSVLTEPARTGVTSRLRPTCESQRGRRAGWANPVRPCPTLQIGVAQLLGGHDLPSGNRL